jgi:hypothetical protein
VSHTDRQAAPARESNSYRKSIFAYEKVIELRGGLPENARLQHRLLLRIDGG